MARKSMTPFWILMKCAYLLKCFIDLGHSPYEPHVLLFINNLMCLKYFLRACHNVPHCISCWKAQAPVQAQVHHNSRVCSISCCVYIKNSLNTWTNICDSHQRWIGFHRGQIDVSSRQKNTPTNFKCSSTNGSVVCFDLEK